jgi:hypothetical protein
MAARALRALFAWLFFLQFTNVYNFMIRPALLSHLGLKKHHMAKILAFDGKQTDPPNNILRKISGRPKNTALKGVRALCLKSKEALVELLN